MSIRQNIENLKNELPEFVKLVAVSKTKSVEEILEAYETGHRIFGENKAQELISKQPQLPQDIQWHFIGHMQTNKVRYIAPFVSLIESVDSLKLLNEINKQASNHGRVIDCLLQFHIAEEETKFGLDFNEATGILNSDEFQAMKNVRICGVMGMATFTEDTDQVRKEFQLLKEIFSRLKNKYFIEQESFRQISMGMSGDYKIAVEVGSTIVRIGSLIFGGR